LLALPFRPVTAGVLLPALCQKCGRYAMPGARKESTPTERGFEKQPPTGGHSNLTRNKDCTLLGKLKPQCLICAPAPPKFILSPIPIRDWHSQQTSPHPQGVDFNITLKKMPLMPNV
jgi:hypothetical protein